LGGGVKDVIAVANGEDPPADPDSNVVVLEKMESLRVDILDGIDGLQDTIDDLGDTLSLAISNEISGSRQQALMGALSLSLSARDLLYSHDANPDVVVKSEISADASRAFRNTLAQAIEITTSKEGYSPTVATVATAVSAVALSLTIRTEVAALFETDELAADRITRQFDAAADFFESVDRFYRGTMAMVADPYIADSSEFSATLIIKDTT
jgi:hypothetical protein